jgi:hypothetical protein
MKTLGIGQSYIQVTLTQVRPGHMCNMCSGIGPPKNEGLNFFLYRNNISELWNVKFNILHKTANIQLLNL